VNDIDLSKPIKLNPRQFTDLTRTPWAGRLLSQTLKKNFCAANTQIGESWEVSCDPSFPSVLADDPLKNLIDIISSNPRACLSPALADTGTCEILLKVLNSDLPLSLQCHPSDGDSSLAAGDGGKPESWFVLHAEPESGIYLGFKEPISKSLLKDELKSGSFSEARLQFVPVQPGDYFDIPPGVAHAIAPGTILLEPQRITEGKSGKTFRIWDWNRKYDSQGRVDPTGKPRELHVEQALRLIDPETQAGPDFVNSLRRKPEVKTFNRWTIRSFPSNGFYKLLYIEGSGLLQLSLKDGYAAALCTVGSLNFVNSISLGMGESAFIPAAASDLSFESSSQSALAVVIPAHCQTQFS
jgi:mannose-6-phosphate isomerase